MQADLPPSQRVSRRATVPAELAGKRFDQVAAVLFADFSRALLSRWIEAGTLTVNGAAARPKARLAGGERLVLEAELPLREDWTARDPVDFAVVFEDPELLVVDKPAGVVVHPGAGNPRGTLVNGLLQAHPELAHLPRAGIVHRLDKDTSGLLLVARTLKVQQRLAALLARREVSRRYLAVAEGLLAGDVDVDRPIGRDPARRTRQAVRSDGRPARTRVKVRERYRAHTLLEASLETGRTHQIRVHLAALGHPLVGDGRYGARRRLPPQADAATVAALRSFPRQALHAWRLAFSHPTSGAEIRLEAALPGDLQALIEVLRADTAP